MPDLGLDKVISSMFLSPETDKHLMEQNTFRMIDCFAVGKRCNVLRYESLFIARLCVKWGNIDLCYPLKLILLFSSQIYISLVRGDLMRVW